jgi:hypothetical protein
MLRENHTVLGGKNIDFRRGGGIIIRFVQNIDPCKYTNSRSNLAYAANDFFLAIFCSEPKINLNKDFYMFFGFDLYFNKS